MPGACVPSGLPVGLETPPPLSRNDGRVPKDMRELMEGGGEPTDGGAAEEVGRGVGGGGGGGAAGAVRGGGAGGGTPCSRRVGAGRRLWRRRRSRLAGPSMTLGEEAQERWEAPARSARGKERAV